MAHGVPFETVLELIPLIPASAFKAVKVGQQTYYCFSKNVRLPSLGKVRLVISFDNPDLTGTCAVLVTNHLTWSAKKIIETYLLRWPIETFYQDAKQQLGLNDYRMRSATAIQKHWCLVFNTFAKKYSINNAKYRIFYGVKQNLSKNIQLAICYDNLLLKLVPS